MKGIEGIGSLTFNKEIDNSNYYNQFTLIISLFENYINLIENNTFFNDQAKKTFYKLVWFLFYSKILWTVFYKIDNNWENYSHVNRENVVHDDFGITLKRFCRLALDCLNFLGNNELIVINNTHKKNVINQLTNMKGGLS
jgi:hypothetical protein